MKTLNNFIKTENSWRAIFNSPNSPQLEITTSAGRRDVAALIDNKLSQENLTCDGELPVGEVRRRFRELTTCANELLAIDPSITFSEF